MDGSPEQIKVLLRDLVECIVVSGEEVTLSYRLKSPGAKVAHQSPLSVNTKGGSNWNAKQTQNRVYDFESV